MIQRIQSVFLLCGVLCLAAFAGFGQAWVRVVTGLHAALPIGIGIMAVLAALSGFVAILMFKDREKQARVIGLSLWLDLGLLCLLAGAVGFLGFGSNSTGLTIPALLSLLLPIAAYVFFRLARRAVLKDITLVRSVDRLR